MKILTKSIDDEIFHNNLAKSIKTAKEIFNKDFKEMDEACEFLDEQSREYYEIGMDPFWDIG